MYAPLCSLQQLFTIAEIGKQNKVYIDGWMDKGDAVQIQWTTTRPWKEWNPAIWDNMDGLWRCYAEWDKSGGKKQIPHVLKWK